MRHEMRHVFAGASYLSIRHPELYGKALAYCTASDTHGEAAVVVTDRDDINPHLASALALGPISLLPEKQMRGALLTRNFHQPDEMSNRDLELAARFVDIDGDLGRTVILAAKACADGLGISREIRLAQLLKSAPGNMDFMLEELAPHHRIKEAVATARKWLPAVTLERSFT